MAILWALFALAAAGDSPYVQRDLEKIRADYLIVAPPAFAGALDALCDHRAKTYRVAIARTDDVAARHGPGPEGVAKLVAAVKPRFLLLAGDADAVPAFVRKSEYATDLFPADADVATDHLYGAAAGRFPADTEAELRAMVEKTLEYETASRPGAWQKKVAFVTGEGGFGETVDTLLEAQFSAVVTKRIPPEYDIELAYAKPASKYSLFPPRFNENAVRVLNEGALFYAYVGHGRRTSFDEIYYKGEFYPIFDAKNVKEVDVKGGLPVMVVIACSTGEFDSKVSDCIGEQLFKRRRGPAAFIGGSRITQPYANALLGHKMVEQVFDRRAATVGEALARAKAGVLERDASPLRKQADAMAALIQGPQNLEPMRKDVVLHYNLFGDPALVIQRPPVEIKLETGGVAARGGKVAVRGEVREGPVEITFECARNRFYYPTYLVEGEDLEKQLAARYANANNKVILRVTAAARDGKFEAEVALPEDIKPGTYYLKAAAPGAIGALAVEIGD